MKNKEPIFYKIFKMILGPIFKFYYKPKIIGKENIPKDGPILVVGNHKHLYDQCLAILATKRVIHYMAKKEYFDDKKVAWFFKISGCISVDRKNKDREAASKAINLLNNGQAVGLFPEGTRNRTEAILLPFKFGTVSMAKKTNAYLVPFGIKGDYKFRSGVTIKFGKPFKVGKMNLEVANKKLSRDIKKLMR